jgi:predicted ATPase
VGRQVEIEALHQALAQAGAGHGQVVSVIGEPGVGNTRFFHEFAEGLVCGEEAARIAEAAGHLSSAIFTQLKLGQIG